MTATTSATDISSSLFETGCCPRFDPASISDQEIVWENRLFVREHVRALLFIPLNMKQHVLHATAQIEAAGAQLERGLMLSADRSPWSADLLIEVSKEVPGAEMVHLSGRFLAKVFEGSYGASQRWMEEMEEEVTARGHHIQRLFYGYTTCPKCAKAYGKNYVVLYAQVAP